LKGEFNEIIKKLNNTETLYKDAYNDNEKILKDFDEFKRNQEVLINNKEMEIYQIKSNISYIEDKIKTSSLKIQELDSTLNIADRE